MVRFLRKARTDAHMTQSDVATALGVAVRTVQRWEAGEEPRQKHAEAIAAFVTQLDIVDTGHPVPPRPEHLRREASRLVVQCLETADAMIRSDETNPPGWRFHLYVLVNFLRRAAAPDGLIFVEEAEYIIGLQRLGTNWREENFGADRWVTERNLLIDCLVAIRDLKPEQAQTNGHRKVYVSSSSRR
jgi:transcriptional regulator with XRE-family HTH domain